MRCCPALPRFRARQNQTKCRLPCSRFPSATTAAALATAFAGLAIYGYLGLYPTFLRGALALLLAWRAYRSAAADDEERKREKRERDGR